MSPATKLALRRFALRWLRKLVDVADDRLHAAQVRLQKEIAAQSCDAAGDTPARTAIASNRPTATDETAQEKPHHRTETYVQWEARRSGIAPISKKSARQRRERQGATAFDLRYAR